MLFICLFCLKHLTTLSALVKIFLEKISYFLYFFNAHPSIFYFRRFFRVRLAIRLLFVTWSCVTFCWIVNIWDILGIQRLHIGIIDLRYWGLLPVIYFVRMVSFTIKIFRIVLISVLVVHGFVDSWTRCMQVIHCLIWINFRYWGWMIARIVAIAWRLYLVHLIHFIQVLILFNLFIWTWTAILSLRGIRIWGRTSSRSNIDAISLCFFFRLKS